MADQPPPPPPRPARSLWWVLLAMATVALTAGAWTLTHHRAAPSEHNTVTLDRAPLG